MLIVSNIYFFINLHGVSLKPKKHHGVNIKNSIDLYLPMELKKRFILKIFVKYLKLIENAKFKVGTAGLTQ